MKQWLNSLLFTVALVVSLGACGTDQPDESAGDTLADSSGQALFRGLVLHDGPVAQAVPYIRDQFSLEATLAAFVGAEEVKDTTSMTREVYDQLLANIAARNPAYFEQFRTQVLSGEYEQVEAAMSAAKTELKAAFEDLMPTSDLAGKTQALGAAQPAQPDCVALQFAIAVATVYLVAAVVQEIVVVSNCEVGTGGRPCQKPRSVPPTLSAFDEEVVIADFVALTAS